MVGYVDVLVVVSVEVDDVVDVGVDVDVVVVFVNVVLVFESINFVMIDMCVVCLKWWLWCLFC